MAATRAHVSQSAITNAVLLLEESLGVRLFDRKPHGVGLTAEGHSFYRRTRDILDALEDALREPRFQAHHLKGAIRIGASYTVLGYFLPQLLARFRANYPGVELDLHDMNREAIEAGVVVLQRVGVDRQRPEADGQVSRRGVAVHVKGWMVEGHVVIRDQHLSVVAERAALELTAVDHAVGHRECASSSDRHDG